MIQKIFSVFLWLGLLSAYAQENTSSQYSLHGLGIKRFKGAVASTSVGGLSLFSDAISPNLLNPATYADLERTAFSVGGSFTSLNIEGTEGSTTVNNTTFDYLSVSIPTKILGFGFGIVPHSSVGHKITTTNEDSENEIEGSGDVNRLYLGLGAKVYKGLKIGAELRYNFGRLENTILKLPTDGGDPDQTIEQTDVSGFTYTFSGLYDFEVKEKYILRASYQYEGSANHTFRNVQEIASVRINSTARPTVDAQNREFVDIDDRSFELPSRSTFGLALIKKNQWSVGGEAYMSKVGDFKDRFKNRSVSGQRITFRNTYGLKVGGHITPNINSLTGYFKRVDYRFGFRYDRLDLIINSTEINEFGISFGLGLPLPRGYSNIDLGFEFGARGENNADAIKEQFINFSLGLNLSDKWFRKRKYN